MRHVSTSSRQRQSPHERHLPWQRLLFPQDFTRTFHLYDFSIHIVDPAHPNFRIPRYVSDAAASLGFFFFSFSLLLFISCSFFDNPIYRSSIFLTSTWFAQEKKSSNLEKTLIFLSSRKLVGGIGSIILFVHSGLYFLNKSNDESLYSTFQSSTEFSFFLENSSRLSPLSLCFFDVSFFDICTAWRILFLQSNGSLCFELGSKRSFLFCLLKFSRGDSAKNRWPWKVRSLIFFDSRKEERGNKRILNFIRTIESVD